MSPARNNARSGVQESLPIPTGSAALAFPEQNGPGSPLFRGETVKSDRIFSFHFAPCEAIVRLAAALRFGKNLAILSPPGINLVAASCRAPLASWVRSECLLSLGGRGRSSAQPIIAGRVTLARITIQRDLGSRDDCLRSDRRVKGKSGA